MSETAPESTPHRQSGSPFLRKLGPLPLWAWMGIGLGLALAFSLWEKNKKAAASSSQASSSGSTGAVSTTASGTPSDLIPQFVNQVFQSPTPPADVTVTNQQTVTNPPPAVTPPPKTVQRPQPTQESQYPAPSGFGGQKLSGTSIRLKWNAESDLYGNPNATYTWVVKDSQGNTKTGTTPGTNATVSGLKPNTGYSIGVYVTQDSTHQNGSPTYSYVTT